MLFNSYEFIFLYFPIVFGGFLFLSAVGRRKVACSWLAIGSVFFYGYWSPKYLILLLASIAINYLLSLSISRHHREKARHISKVLMIIGVVLNLGLLAYFKYVNFFIDTVSTLSGIALPAFDVVLPIGISFFTFTQIAFLVDCYEGKVTESDPVYYLLFVTYFPHLIAGPVLHHAEMMPQFSKKETYAWNQRNFIIGITFFCIGLFKKVILADGIQPYVAPAFDSDGALDMQTAWAGALAYTLQLYFDFSGYSDMAVGLSKMFNVDLPVNFNSPYRAVNIIEFWRRWHITLSRFLRDYLYIRLGGNRNGQFWRHVNLMITMLLGGLWHGAGWTFVIWGGLHGFYLIVNHLFRQFAASFEKRLNSEMMAFASHTITILAVVIAWVFFRAHNVEDGLRVLNGMFGGNGFGQFSLEDGDVRKWLLIGAMLCITIFLPNSQQFINRCFTTEPSGSEFAAKLGLRWTVTGAIATLIVMLAIINGSRGPSEFIYFNF